MTLTLEHAILGLLNERPLTGYELKNRWFDGDLKPFWEADQAQIYRTLHRLQGQGLVSSRRRRQSGRPDRRVFDVTHRGREALAEWTGTPQSPPVPRDPLLIQLLFGTDSTDDRLLEVLRARRASHQLRLDDLCSPRFRGSRNRSAASVRDVSPLYWQGPDDKELGV